MKWNKTCSEFKTVREAIHNGDTYEIMKGMLAICKKYAEEDWIFSYDFDDLALEIEISDAMETGNEEDVDYYLGEFYDLCDAAGVWLAI